MIITQKKPIEEVMALVGDAKTVGIIGCGSCATACQTGGEPQQKELAAVLEAAGKKVVAMTMADYCCMNLGVKGLPMKLGIEMAAELIAKIKDEKLCDGVHIMAIGAEKNVPVILDKAGIAI